jgi:hypothetical protein
MDSIKEDLPALLDQRDRAYKNTTSSIATELDFVRVGICNYFEAIGKENVTVTIVGLMMDDEVLKLVAHMECDTDEKPSTVKAGIPLSVVDGGKATLISLYLISLDNQRKMNDELGDDVDPEVSEALDALEAIENSEPRLSKEQAEALALYSKVHKNTGTH